MQVKKNPTFKELVSSFPIEIPKNLVLTDSYADAVEETDPFRKLTWDQVTPNLLRKNFEVACFFSPEAMHYFLPSFINCTLQNIDMVDLPLDYLFRMMSYTDEPSRNEWRLERWKRLSTQQWEIINKWLLWLIELPETTDMNSLRTALDSVETGIWRTQP